MIVFGGNQFVPFLIEDDTLPTKKWSKLNFYNSTMIGKNIAGMIPPQQLMSVLINNVIDKETFDYEYCTYLINDQNAFVSFMDIMMSHYYNGNTFVLYDDENSWVVGLVEIIIQLLYQRYGIVCPIVNEPMDLYWVDEDFILTPEGNHMFDMDKERYTRYTFKQNSIVSDYGECI